MKKILSGAFLGTSVMTLVSYLYSAFRAKNFREPRLLTILFQRWFPSQPLILSAMEAWVIHYMIGFLFVSVYAFFWKHNYAKATVKNGFLMGAITGIPAVFGWHITLLMHPNPPVIDLVEFYAQLVVVHAIFGAFAAIGYKNTK